MIAFCPDRDRVYVDGIPCPCRTYVYCKNGGGENDYISVIREDNGRPFTARLDQIAFAPNPTLDIEEASDDR
jgi:hypothetical protein